MYSWLRILRTWAEPPVCLGFRRVLCHRRHEPPCFSHGHCPLSFHRGRPPIVQDILRRENRYAEFIYFFIEFFCYIAYMTPRDGVDSKALWLVFQSFLLKLPFMKASCITFKRATSDRFFSVTKEWYVTAFSRFWNHKIHSAHTRIKTPVFCNRICTRFFQKNARICQLPALMENSASMSFDHKATLSISSIGSSSVTNFSSIFSNGKVRILSRPSVYHLLIGFAHHLPFSELPVAFPLFTFAHLILHYR